MDQDGPVHGVSDVARFSHFKPSFEETTNVKNWIVDANCLLVETLLGAKHQTVTFFAS